LLDVEYTSLFHKQYVIAAENRNGYPKQKHPKVKNEGICTVPFVRSRVKIKTTFWSKLEVLHATEKKTLTWKDVFFNNILHFSIT